MLPQAGNGEVIGIRDQPLSAADATAAEVVDPAVPAQHRAGMSPPGVVLSPCCHRADRQRDRHEMLLVKPEHWLGSDPSCPICRPDDPFCEPRHVRLFRTPNGSWYAEHNV